MCGRFGYRAGGWLFLVSTLLLALIAGWVAGRATGEVRPALSVGMWSGILSGLIALAAMIGVTTGVVDALIAGVNHLWMGPLAGVILGAIGAYMAMPFRKTSA